MTSLTSATRGSASAAPMVEDVGVQGCGAFYEATGAIGGVVQNHRFQVLANVAMEPPVRTDSESIAERK